MPVAFGFKRSIYNKLKRNTDILAIVTEKRFAVPVTISFRLV